VQDDVAFTRYRGAPWKPVALPVLAEGAPGRKDRRVTERTQVLAICAISLLLPCHVSSAQDGDVRGWSIAYADGRVITHVLKPKGGLWTPLFPKVEEISIARTGPAKYLDIQYVMEGQDLVATISLLTNGFRDRVSVAVVRVRGGEPVAVEQLRKYGVAPVTLSIVPIDPVHASPAIVSEPSGQLVVRVEPMRPDAPIYRFQVVNQDARAVRAFDFEAYQGDTRFLSGRRKTDRNEPLILSGQEYAFELAISNKNGNPWRTLDHVVITSVMWDDGAVDGDPKPAVQEQAGARGRAIQLRTLVNALTSGNATLATLRAAFIALDGSDRALENARKDALMDLNRLQDAGIESVSIWVAQKTAEYSDWLSRCERVVQQQQR
jgi:hypothetical protein